MASSNANLPPSSAAAAFDMHKLFKPPPQNPNPNPNASAPFAPFHYHPLPQQQQQPQPFLYPPYPSPHSAPSTPSPNHGAHLMALLSAPPLETATSLPPASYSSFAPPLPTAPPAPAPARAGSAKLPKGRRLSTGDRALYDVDVRLPGEPQPPQLEVSPITKYVSDPGLVLGRQIAVNRTYICYGLKLGAIRVLNINTALRSLLKGHGQRVTDMAFFAEDVHLLASASSDGRIFIWKINEGPDDSDKPQITEKTIVAIQIEANEQSVHPRVCWHCHKQEILAIGIGNLVLKIDTTKVGKNEPFTSEKPLQCSVEKLIDGVQLVGKHEGEVTDLSMSQWMTTRLVSSSRDGTIKIWDDRNAIPLATIRPHDGHPVYSVVFVAAPHRPEHIVLITAGPLNKELKIWVSASPEGWLLPGESESWHCTQTLELRSSSVARVEDAFFNQVVALPQAGLILLANAKKNAIYAVHVDYGPNPVSTRMDYISEFMVTMPILSLTGTTDCLPDGEQVVQVYCVQTQAIQQYALDLAQCLPPTLEATRLENAPRFSQSFEPPTLSPLSHLDSSHGTVATEISVGNVLSNSQVSPSSYETTIWSAVSGASESLVIQEPVAFNMESKNYTPAISSLDGNVSHMSPQSALNLDMSQRLLAPRGSAESLEQVRLVELASNQGLTDYSVERRSEDFISVIASATANPSMGESASALQSSYLSKADNNAPHLITPSEILSGAIASFENTTIVQEQKMGESAIQNIVEHVLESDKFEVTVLDASPSGDLFVENEKPTAESLQPKVETFNEASSSKAEVSFKDVSQTVDARDSDGIEEPLSADTGEDLQEMANDISEKVIDSTETEEELPGAKGRKHKANHPPASGASSFSASPFNSMDLGNEHVGCSGAIFNDAALSTIYSLQDTVNKMLAAQKEMQKQLSATVALPVTKEGRRIETSLGRSMEKTMKSNVDALWARFQEESAKREKSERERLQQVTSLLTNSMTKELPALLEKTLKKEISAIGPVIARTVTPVLEKTISSTVADCFQRSVGDKVVTQLEKSINAKLEPMLGRQIHAQFQSSGKQALQEALRSTLESSVVPAFEKSCKSMFEQVDATFHKGMSEHSASSQKQFESTHTSLALTLRDAINSVSSITQTLTNDVADGQRKLLALLSSGNQKSLNSMAIQQGSDALGGLPMQAEVPVDPTKELVRLVSDRKFEEAFTLALQRSDVVIVSWLCSQVDLQGICLMVPLPLSQGVLLALFQQLACDLGKDTSQKLAWMTEVATVINPSDPTIALHVRPIFEQICQILIHQRSLPTTSPSQATSIRLILHVINAVLISCK